ncbi:MAG: transketolase, partial [Muribaculaceae bacterium]|nr:transketolase [Muribaculaceae bacterium]
TDIPAAGESRMKECMQAERGGYLVVKPESTPDVNLVANGSEVSLLVSVAAELETRGIKASVASVPSIGLFLNQSDDYRHSVMSDNVPRFGLTAGLPICLYPLMAGAAKWKVYGLERFGASAPFKVLDQKFGYTVENITDQVLSFLGK